MKINKERIKYELTRKNWTMGRLAKELGVTRQGAHYLVAHSRSLKAIERIGRILGMPPMDLIEK